MTSTPPSIFSSVLTFVGGFIVMAVAINIALWAMVTYAGMSTESGGGLGFMPVILGAMFAGQRYGKLAGAKPLSGYSWLASFWFAVSTVAIIALAWFIVLQLAYVNLGLGSFDEIVAEIGMGPLIGIAAGFFLLIWVLQRFIFSFGAGQSVKLAERTAAKSKV